MTLTTGKFYPLSKSRSFTRSVLFAIAKQQSGYDFPLRLLHLLPKFQKIATLTSTWPRKQASRLLSHAASLLQMATRLSHAKEEDLWFIHTGYPTYLPTSTISRSTILNRTRGKFFFEQFVYICDLSTPTEVYKEINATMKDVVKKYNDEFKGFKFFPTVRSDDPTKMNITLELLYAHNCVNYNRKLYCRTLVSDVIRNVFNHHSVRATTETRLYNDQGGLAVVQLGAQSE